VAGNLRPLKEKCGRHTVWLFFMIHVGLTSASALPELWRTNYKDVEKFRPLQ